ncbi:hypothetical protein E1176_12535 [Fulvivirga sp. RKSG066]|nr:hypothetical protein [Fulvivirga aurantia]
MYSIIFTLLATFTGIDNADLPKFSGTFIDENYQTTVQMKVVEDSIQGVLIQSIGVFPFHGSIEQGQLIGKIYTKAQHLSFKATPAAFGFQLDVEGISTSFYRTSHAQELDNYDLTAYFSQKPESVVHSAPANNDNTYYNLIAGGQLVYYTRSSILSSSNASSITYLNFCANGTYNRSYDGSYSVEGNYGGNAHGASSSNEYGRWEVVKYQGVPAVRMVSAGGETNYHAIDASRLEAGRWRQGNTQFAFQRGKAVCY